MARWLDFTKCPSCGYDIGTGEGTRACSWGDCANVPPELDVFCAYCRFNFLTMEGNPPCPDPVRCDHAAEPMAHVANFREWQKAHATTTRR